MKPNPKAAPIRPMRVFSCAGVETSPMYALATAKLPLNTPAMNLAVNAMNNVLANPNMVKNTVFPIRPTIKTGLRPIRSDTEPQNGENRNCAAEYEVISKPTHNPTSTIP